MTNLPIPAGDLPELGPVSTQQYLVHIGALKLETKSNAMRIMTTPAQAKTRQQVVAEFATAGITQTEWARVNGFHRLVVVGLLRGANLGRWGESHRCAVALGLKAGEVVALNQFKPAPQRRSQDTHTGVAA